MERRLWEPLPWAFVFLLGLVGSLLYVVGPALTAGAQDFRSLQVWPDRSVGVTSGLLEDSTTHVTTQSLPMGAYRSSEGDIVYARTYLRFPLDVFPPGTEVLHATLHVYVDSGTDVGEATLGVYRALEPWERADWSGDPGTWSEVLTSPLAVTTARFEVMTPTLPVSPTAPTATPGPTATPAVTPTVTPAPSPLLTSTPPTSPLPTPTPSLAVTVPIVRLEQVADTWVSWDVTALMRAWVAGDVPNVGLVLASAPDPAADPEEMGNLLVARWFTATDLDTRPHVIVEFDVKPVTPTPPTSPLSTPPPTPAPVLPPAGSAGGWQAVGLVLIGAVLLILGLAQWKR